MIQQLLDQLIITAGQWQLFGEKYLESKFENLLTELQNVTGLNRESAIELLIKNINKRW